VHIPTNKIKGVIMSDLVQDTVLPVVEVAVEQLIEAQCDKAVDALIQKLVDVCPVDALDQVILAFKPKAQEIIKAELLNLAEKISVK
jgi:uncharacterized protein (DUF2384 family)